MLNRLLEQRWPITVIFNDEKYARIVNACALKPRDEHWNLRAELLPVFKSLQVATTAMSSEIGPYSSVYPILYGLVHIHLAANDDDSAIASCFKKLLRTILKGDFN